MSYPILYSFRRCPYAIRARLALRVSGIQVELREVVLSDKPAAFLACSEKATVPVLVLDEQHVIDESLDIMYWALEKNDPEDWLVQEPGLQEVTEHLINYNDNEFKTHLDHYKYFDRFPEYSMEYYREQGEIFLADLEARLNKTNYLLGQRPTLVDMAIFPFIRQFSYADKNWFDQSQYTRLQAWLTQLLEGSLFASVMVKYEQWQPGNQRVLF